MKILSSIVLAGLLGVALACGDSSGPGARAASVTGVAGDSQDAPTNAPLAFPLSLVTLGSNGQPVQGVNVSWTVTPAGGATFNPQVSVSDVNGTASTNVTAGSDTGVLVIQATVPGVSPVIYHIAVLDPCNYAAPYTFGQTVNGALATTDCVVGQWYYDYYAFGLPPGQQSIRIDMKSGTFDTFADLYNTDGQIVGFDDDSILGVKPNSQLDIILPSDVYIIGANSYDAFTVGPYSLTAAPRAAAMRGCRQVWVTRGVTVTDSITLNDCADSSASTHYYDVARIIAFAGSVLSIAERSTAINPRLALYRVYPGNNYSRRLLMANDDSANAGTTTNSFIGFLVDTSSVFDVIIGTSDTAAGETGAYTFEVSASSTFSTRASAPLFGSRGWWRSAGIVPKRSKR